MICDDCRKKDTPRGIKEIHCRECEDLKYVGLNCEANLCKRCSDKLGICSVCNKNVGRLE